MDLKNCYKILEIRRTASLTEINKAYHALVKGCTFGIIKSDSGSGSMLIEQVPVEKYELKYAVGDTWYGTRWLFGPKTIFRKMDHVFEFKVHDNEIIGYRLNLYLQPTKPAVAGKDDAFDF
jgi:hypothetical protein